MTASEMESTNRTIESVEGIRNVIEASLDDAFRRGPPEKIADFVPKDDWSSVTSNLAGYLVNKDRENYFLEQLEIAGARLMLSSDQKRLRPVIGMKLLDWLGPEVDRENALKAFTSIEAVHFYTKGIDDIMDEDMWRNNFPTVESHMKKITKDEDFARYTALDYFLDIKTRNYGIMDQLEGELENTSVEVSELDQALRAVERQLSDGQTMDLGGTLVGKLDQINPNYLGGDADMMKYTHKTNRGKTAALFSLVGRYAQELTGYEGDELEQWGLKAGEAFQIEDDVLDLKNGRNSDIKNNNYTVPLMIAERFLHSHNIEDPDNPDYNHHEEMREKGERLTEIMRMEDYSKGEEELEEAYQIIKETPALVAAENLSRQLSETSIEHLSNVRKEEDHPKEIENFTRLMGYQREK